MKSQTVAQQFPQSNASADDLRSEREQPTHRVCTACVMDTSDPDLVFDQEGVCQYHEVYNRTAPHVWKRGKEGETRLSAILEQIKRTGARKQYDCVVGVSGGVDSSFVLYNAVQRGLRPLAVHFDNGWNSDAAVVNIERLVRALNLELFTYVVDWQEFRDVQLSFIKASVPNLEIPTDHAIYALLYIAAAQHGIKYILSGNNYSTENTMPFAWGYHFVDSYHVAQVHKIFGSVPIKSTPLFSVNQYLWHRFVRGVTNVRMLNFLDYHKENAIETLEKNFGWRRYARKHYESRYTQFFQSYILPTKFGYDKRKAHLTSLILSGQMTRDEALQELREPPFDPLHIKDDMIYVSKKFGVSVDELHELLSRPPKKFSDYPSQYAYMCWLSRVEKFMRGFSGLSRHNS